MSNTAAAPRHAFGWPPGSIRALLALMIVGLVCALMLIPTKDPVPIPAYLIYLMFLVLGHYFAARGHAPTQGDTWSRQPLWLPRGCVRLILLGALAATTIYKYSTEPDRLHRQWELSVESLREVPMLPIIVLTGFAVGALIRMVVGQYPPPWFQDLEAWLALICVLLLGVSTLIHLVIDPSLSERLSLPAWESITSAVVAFYFGERS
jgi:hypothetical protein